MSEIDKSREEAIEAGANMSSGRVNFNYVDTTKAERLGLDRYNTKKPKGYNFIRIVTPSRKGAFAKEIWKHVNVGADGNTYLCLDQMFGKTCPVCEHIRKLKRENPNDDAIKELAVQRRFLLFVVDTTSVETEKEGPKWFDCPPTIYQQICSLSIDKRTGKRIDPTDPEDGRDIEFTRFDGKRTSYGSFELKRTDPIPKSWYEDLPSFDDILLIPDAEEVAKAVFGVLEDKSDREEQHEGETTKKSRARFRSERSEEEVEKDNRRTQRSEDKNSRFEDSERAKAVSRRLDEITERRKRERERE